MGDTSLSNFWLFNTRKRARWIRPRTSIFNPPAVESPTQQPHSPCTGRRVLPAAK